MRKDLAYYQQRAEWAPDLIEWGLINMTATSFSGVVIMYKENTGLFGVVDCLLLLRHGVVVGAWRKGKLRREQLYVFGRMLRMASAHLDEYGPLGPETGGGRVGA